MDSIKKLTGVFGITLIVVAVTLTIPTYLVSHTNLQTNMMYDGWERIQFPTPPFLVDITGGAWTRWAGGFWFILDTLLFWFLVGSGLNLYQRELREPGGFSEYEEYRSDYWRSGRPS